MISLMDWVPLWKTTHHIPYSAIPSLLKDRHIDVYARWATHIDQEASWKSDLYNTAMTIDHKYCNLKNDSVCSRVCVPLREMLLINQSLETLNFEHPWRK